MESKSFEALKEFIQREWSVGSRTLSRETTLEGDLGITGDDGVQLIDKFRKEFEVDFPQDFDYSKYFGPEGLDLIGVIKRAFTKKEFRDETIPITLGHLEDAIVRKEWQYL